MDEELLEAAREFLEYEKVQIVMWNNGKAGLKRIQSAGNVEVA